MVEIRKGADLNKIIGRLLELLSDEKCEIPLRKEQINSLIEAGN
jgi:hypothetical protein